MRGRAENVDHEHDQHRNGRHGRRFCCCFLLLYDVSVRVDRWITNAAGIGVLGVAFLPGSPPDPHLTTSQEVIGNLHVFFASIAFLGLAATMWRFAYAVSDGPEAPPPSPRR